MTAPCRRREGRPISGTTGRAAGPWGCAAARSARWQAWAWTPAQQGGCPLASTPPPPGAPATLRGRPAAEGPRPTPPMPMAMVTRRRVAVTIETGCCTWAPEPRWRMLYLCTSHPGGSARTVDEEKNLQAFRSQRNKLLRKKSHTGTRFPICNTKKLEDAGISSTDHGDKRNATQASCTQASYPFSCQNERKTSVYFPDIDR
nr:E3 ubiquitin-protein ligase ZNRF1 isoform X3 [Macaca fascicularis]